VAVAIRPLELRVTASFSMIAVFSTSTNMSSRHPLKQQLQQPPSKMVASDSLLVTHISVISGAGTNSKVGDYTSSTKRRNFFLSCPSTFSALRVQLVVSVSAFVMASTVWSVYCLLFFYSRCSSCPVIC